MNFSKNIKLFILFLIILNSGGIPLVKRFYISILIFALIFIYKIIFRKKEFLSNYSSLMVLVAILFFNYLTTSFGTFVYEYLIYFSFFLIASLVYSIYDNKYALVVDIQKVLIFFMYHALIAFFVQILFNNQFSLYTYGSYEAKTFLNLFYHPYGGNDLFIRNMGLFWEPGILQFYMNILFYISIFIIPNKKYAVIAAFLIFSAYSTVGILIFIFQFLFFFFANNQIKRVYKILFLPIFTIIMFLLINLFIFDLSSKIAIRSDNRSSLRYSARIYDLYTGYNLVKNFPFLGIGLDLDQYLNKQKRYGYIYTELRANEEYGRGGTNSIIKILYQFGFIMSGFIFYFLFNQKIFKNKYILFFLILFITLLSEPIFMTPFIILILYSGVSKKYA